MILARKVAPVVLKTLRDISNALNGAPVPLKALSGVPALTMEINWVRTDAGLNQVHSWPSASHVMEKALQYLRKTGEIIATKQGWVLNELIIEPTRTLTPEEWDALNHVFDMYDNGAAHRSLFNKVLEAVRHRLPTKGTP
jgi:hypothetical protein